jgi:hypothetical protein
MTLTDLLLVGNLPDADAKQYALVFDQGAHDALIAAQAQRPDAHHRVAPVQLADGRWILCADLLTEIGPGGLYADGFSLLPPELFALVVVMPWFDALALLPQPEPERARDEQSRFLPNDPVMLDVNEAWVQS